MIIDGKVYRNLEGQVAYLTEYLNSNAVAAELGIKVLGQYDDVSDIPEGEYNYGDAFMIGTEVPYTMYIWSRAGGNHPEDYWFNVGRFPMPGPQGEPGLGVDDLVRETLTQWANITSTYNSDTDITDITLDGTKTRTFDDNTTLTTPEQIRIPIITDGQIVPSYYVDVNNNHAIALSLSKNLDTSYVQQKAPSGWSENQPFVYGGTKIGTNKMNELKPLPIRFIGDNLIMFAGTGNSSDENSFTGTGSACSWNTILGKGNHFHGNNSSDYANTENLCFGGKNEIYSGVQDSSTFGYRNEVYANQAFTAGYKNTNKGSESVVIGNQNSLDDTITIDTTGPDYDGASSNSKQMAVFGYKNIIGKGNQTSLVFGDQNTIGSSSKWNMIGGSHQNIGSHNVCVSALDYGNITEDYVEDSAMIGYYNHIYGGSSGSVKYGVYMIGHDNSNVDSNGNHCSETVLLGNNLCPTGNNCVVVGSYNAGDMDEAFARFVVGTGVSGSPATTIKVFNGETDFTGIIKIGNTSLSEAQLQSLLALI